jgi:dehydrogenase/reductase SDR family member 7B
MEFEGRVAWVTGASSGIGEALAVALAARGARLVLSARRAERLEAVRQRCGEARARVLPLDMTDAASFPDAAARAEALYGRIDLLVNNAGVSHRSLFLETDTAVIRRLLDTDLLGPLLLTRAVIPGMVAKGGGYLLFVSSLTGRVGTPMRTVYSAAKHAIFGFADALRAELYRHSIGVSVVAPGFVRTEVSLASLEGDGRPHGVLDPGQAGGMSAEECAGRILRVLRKEKREAFIALGSRERLALRAWRFAPGFLARKLRTADVV